VKKYAAAREMQDVLWMFQGPKDVDADVQVMMELRPSLALDSGHLEKIVVAQRCSDIFATACEKIKTSLVELKARPSLVLSERFFQNHVKVTMCQNQNGDWFMVTQLTH